MEEVKVCRICLVMDVKMYDLQSHPLNSYFVSTTGSSILTIGNLPPYACYECVALVTKYYAFKQKCMKSQSVLYSLIDHSQKITPLKIKQLDRKALSLSSNLTISTKLAQYSSPVGSIEDILESKEVKNEPLVEDAFAIVDGCVKEENEYDMLSADQGLSSDDDDEPLSLHKEKKNKETEENQIKDEDDMLLDPTEAVTDTTSPRPKKGRPGRPKKTTAAKKIAPQKSKVKHGSQYHDSVLELQNYITVITLSVEEQIEEVNKRKESSNYINSPYQCNLCYKGFIDTDAWQHHVGKHSPSAGDIECQICKFRFKTKRALQKHSSNHEKKYACKSCPYISSNTTQAKQHQGWHKGVTYKCKFCDDIFTVWTSYMSHVRIKHPSEFICGICGYSFISKLGLAMHKTMMHKDVLEKGEVQEEGPYCEECDVKFISVEAYKRHVVMSTKHISNDATIIGCRRCGASFKSAEECRIHHRKEHATKRPKNYGKKPSIFKWPAKCEHCSEEIPNGREHWSHYRRMHPDKKYPIQKDYICDICGKSFRGNAFLVYHKRTHTEERAYKCTQCDKAFHNNTNLQVHMKTHSDSRPYPCSVCYKAFKGKGALNRHFRSHTGQKPYECEVCGKAFSQSNSRKLHVTTVHLKQPAPYVSRRRTKNGNKEPTHQQFIY